MKQKWMLVALALLALVALPLVGCKNDSVSEPVSGTETPPKIPSNVDSLINELYGEGPYVLVATGNWSSGDLSTLAEALKKDESKKVHLDLSGVEELTTIGEWAFSYCSSLVSINIPASVTSIGDSAFEGCSSLTSITIPSNVATIGEWAFSGCSSLTSINIPASVKTIGDNAFDGCSSLTSITIPSNVATIGDRAFGGCSSLKSISIPASVKTIGDNAFGGCSSLNNINVDEDNTTYLSKDEMLLNKEETILIAYPSATGDVTNVPASVTTIGEWAFDGCSSLTSINIPASVKTIGDRAFGGCSSLTSITIPASVTTIGIDAFFVCFSLKSISIPASVQTIGDGAFNGCSGLDTVTMEAATPPTLGLDAFYETSTGLQILVPSGSVDAYQAATNWKDYVAKIKAK